MVDPIAPGLDSTLGATFLGMIVSAVLFGVLSLQAWSYFRFFYRDQWQTRLLVSAVWLCDTMHQIFISFTIYRYMITYFSNPTFMDKLMWSAVIEIFFHGLVAAMVQGFFTTRIYYLSNKNIWLTMPIAALVLCQFVLTLIFAGKALQDQTFHGLDGLRHWSLSLSAVTVVANIVITIVQCVLLLRTPTKSKKTEMMVIKLMRYSVITGVLTSVDAICTLATLAAMPNNFIYTFFFFSLGRLYSNSLLASLNNRKLPRGGTSQENHTSSYGQGGGGGGAMALTTIGGGVRPNISIKIDTTQEYNYDPHASKSAETDLDMKESEAQAL